jgi:hypothetical protein|uniref:Uncharacterized protein n=1 Tax=Fagus sylvatica TaxID=28930 RepID=A0A2N9EWK4_FAGSY
MSSILQYPDAINAPDLQIWNNAAFDNEESEGSAAFKSSWSNLHTVNLSESLESDCSKENLSPLVVKTPVPVKSSVPIKPLCPNSLIRNSQGKPFKLLVKEGLLETPVVSKKGHEGRERDEKERVCDERKIDLEIEEIQKEIARLSSRLEALRLEKAERNAMKTIERRGRFVPAKFMEPKQIVKNSDLMKKIEETLPSSVKSKINRRGMSLGPSEILAGARARQQQPSKLEITPVQPIQSRRKSCFWKLQDIDELKVIKERGKSLSLSPKSRKTVSKIQAPKQAVTTVTSKRPVKKEDGVVSSIQPKKLFKDGEKWAKKPLKPGRVVASRYNQIANHTNGNLRLSDGRKRSLPENDKDDGKRCDKRRASSVGKSRGIQGTESRVKKRWEVPSDVVVYKSQEDGNAVSNAEMGDVLPKIRTLRCVNESPRDSGPAKRVAQLIGRRSYFYNDEEVETSVCQALSFAEGDAEEE